MNKLALRGIILAVVITLSCFSFAASAQSASLTTLFKADTGISAGGGIYFDLENVGYAPIIITSWYVNVNPGTNDVKVWYRTGTSQGFEQTKTVWQLLGTEAGVVSLGVDRRTPVNVGGLTIAPGEVFGIAMAGGMSWMYTGGTGSNQIYNDGALEIRTGSANGSPFSAGLVYTPRVWNGTIYYTQGEPIPTLSEWGLIILSLLLAGTGYFTIRRRRGACS